jgi:hypothetical protein
MTQGAAWKEGHDQGFAAGVKAAAEIAVHILREWGKYGTIYRIDDRALKDLEMDVQRRTPRPPTVQAVVPNDSFVAGLKAAAKAAQTAYAEARDSEWDDGFNDARTIIANAIRALRPPAAPANPTGITGDYAGDLTEQPLSASEPAGAKQPQYDCWDEGFPRSAEPAGAPIHSAAVEAAAEQLWEAMLPRRTMQWCISTAKTMLTTAQRNEPAGAPSEEDVARALEDADRRASQRIFSRDYWNYLARAVLALLRQSTK